MSDRWSKKKSSPPCDCHKNAKLSTSIFLNCENYCIVLYLSRSTSPGAYISHTKSKTTYAQIELFLELFPANFCLHCGPYMTELNAENNGGQSEVPHPSSVFLNHSLSTLISVICGPQRRQTFAGRQALGTKLRIC